MKHALILALYLGDELLSSMMPFSSGLFTITLIVISISCLKIKRCLLMEAMVIGIAMLATGFIGAILSGTPVSSFFILTVALLLVMWMVGAGVQEGDRIFITPKFAFIGVLISSGFLVLAVLGWDAMSAWRGELSNRATGIYYEPSHYALYVMPLWLIAYQHQQYRFWLYLTLVLAMALCFSTTLAAFLIFALLLKALLSVARSNYTINKIGRQLILGTLLTIFTYYMSGIFYVDGVTVRAYIDSRIAGLVNPDNGGSQNLSSLVILQGIDLAKISFAKSYGLGVGLGNFGTSDQVLSISEHRNLVNVIMNGQDLSVRDGGLLASKLVGELGIFSLLVLLLLGSYFRRLKLQSNILLLNYDYAFAVTLLCLLFIRALPYFSSPACLAIFSLAGLVTSCPRLPDQSRLDPSHFLGGERS